MGVPDSSSAEPSLRNLGVFIEGFHRKNRRILGGEESRMACEEAQMPKEPAGYIWTNTSSLVGQRVSVKCWATTWASRCQIMRGLGKPSKELGLYLVTHRVEF